MEDEQQLMPYGQPLAVDIESINEVDFLQETKELICQECSELFTRDQVYEGPAHLKESVEEFASKHAFSILRDGSKLAVHFVAKKGTTRQPVMISSSLDMRSKETVR
jgi:hypothetical protein